MGKVCWRQQSWCPAAWIMSPGGAGNGPKNFGGRLTNGMVLPYRKILIDQFFFSEKPVAICALKPMKSCDAQGSRVWWARHHPPLACWMSAPTVAAQPCALRDICQVGPSRWAWWGEQPVTPPFFFKPQKWVWVNTYRYIFSGMNIHLPAILGFTRYQGFDPSSNSQMPCSWIQFFPFMTSTVFFLIWVKLGEFRDSLFDQNTIW